MLLKIKNIIFGIIYFLVIVYLAIYIPCLWGSKPLVIMSGSMEPILKVGGILYYEEIDLNDFKDGDILVYQTKEHIISHRIVDVIDDSFITKGDANNTQDEPITNDMVVGKVIKIIPNANLWKKIIISVVIALIIIFIIVKIIFSKKQLKK